MQLRMCFLYFAVQLQLFRQVFSGRSEVDSKYIFQQNKQRSKRDEQFFPQPATDEVDSNLLVALDDCLRDYIECRVESHLVTLKVENYVLSVVGLRDLFYDGGRATSAKQMWASFYLNVFRQLEYETEFMNYLSDESNKRLKMGAFASDKENMERNILNMFVACLLKHEFHHSGSIYSTGSGMGTVQYLSNLDGISPRLPEGRIRHLDNFVEAYMKLRIKGHTIISRVEQLIDNVEISHKQKSPWLQYYLTVLNGIESNGPGFIRDERKRLLARTKQYNYKYKITKRQHENHLRILNTVDSLAQEPKLKITQELKSIENNYFYNNKRLIFLIIFCIAFSAWLTLTIKDCIQDHANKSLLSPGRRKKRTAKPQSPRKRSQRKQQ